MFEEWALPPLAAKRGRWHVNATPSAMHLLSLILRSLRRTLQLCVLTVVWLHQIAMAQLTAPAAPTLAAPRIPGLWDSTGTMQAIGRLNELRYWTGDNYSLTSDANRQAIIAFQKLSGLSRTGKLNDSTLACIMAAHVLTVHDSIHARHIEVDLDHQVLFAVDSNDQVARILSISTGSGQRFVYPGLGPRYARTPRGKFKVYYKVTGWRKSPLGLLFDPMYITGGIAVHGAQSVPPQPASHGCIRIPMFAAREMFGKTPIGTTVIVFGENPEPAE